MKKLVTVAAMTMGVAVLAYTQLNQHPSTENHAAQTADSSAISASSDIKLAHADQNDVADDTQTEQNMSANSAAADKAQTPQSDVQQIEEDRDSTMSDMDDYGSGDDDIGSMDTNNDGDDGDEDDDSEDTSITVEPS